MKQFRVINLFLIVFLALSCSKDSKDFNSDFSLYKEYILNFSSGLVSASNDIRVVLAFDKKEWTPNQELDSDYFTISPNVDGKVVALSNNTIAFVPKKPLENDKEYQVTFHLSEVKDVPKELKNFNFTIKTIKQDFVINTQDLQSYSKDFSYLNGTITTSDNLDLVIAKKLVQVTQNGKP